jgi:hypothetical protein
MRSAMRSGPIPGPGLPTKPPPYLHAAADDDDDDDDDTLTLLADIAQHFGLTSLTARVTAAAEVHTAQALLGVAVMGQFKAGKSSFSTA